MSHDNPSLFEEITGLSVLKAVLVAVPALALIAASIWVAVHFLDPMPPRRVVLAAGPEGSALHAFGMRYAELVGSQGIKVEVLATRGAADNLDGLLEPKGQAVLGFVVAGTATPEQAQRIVNLSNLTHVPLWCLARAPSGDVTIAGMKGQRLAVGAPGTGLHAWLLPLLRLNGITPENTRLLELTHDESVRALAAGQVDTIFLAEPHGPLLERALSLPDVRLMNFPRAQAYARLFPNIVPLQLPAGTLDLARNIPERDIALIGTSVMLAARSDVHPTVVDLFVDAARQLHSGQGIFDKRGEFPHLHAVDGVDVSDQALEYVREGPSFLRRYLPLWAADAIQRAIVLAVPLFAVMIPLARFLPAILDVIGRRRMFIGYARLRRVERTMRARHPGAAADDLLRELDRIEESVTGVKESVIKAGELYTFRVHVRVVREAVLARVNGALADLAAARSVTTEGVAK